MQWLVTGPALADTALLVAIYTVAMESEWVLVVAAWVILEVGVVMATVRWTLAGSNLKSFVFLTGLAFAALLAGVVVRALRSQLDWLAERAERLELERDQQAWLAAAAERARIAGEMHDVVSHNIQVMVTLADAAAAAQASDPGRAAEAMHEVSSTGRQAMTDMRRMLGVLRDGPGGAGGGGAHRANGSERPSLSPQPGLDDLDALVERVRNTGLDVSVERSGRPFAVSSAAGLTVYRIVQEALTNALKHAHDPGVGGGATGVQRPRHLGAGDRRRAHGRSRAGARRGQRARERVRAPERRRAGGGRGGGGHGVTGMKERAAAFGGTLEAGPRAAGGWEVAATLRDCRAPSTS